MPVAFKSLRIDIEMELYSLLSNFAQLLCLTCLGPKKAQMESILFCTYMGLQINSTSMNFESWQKSI